MTLPEDPLSAMHRRIISMIASGSTDRQIASSLGISIRTLHRRVNEACALLESPNRAALVWEASRRGLVHPDMAETGQPLVAGNALDQAEAGSDGE